MTCWTVGRTHHEIFYRILIVRMFCWTLVKRFRTRRLGSQPALVKLRQRGFRVALHSIHPANLCSLHNKTDKLLLLSRTNRDFSNSAALCFTETWLNDAIPDSVLYLPNFQLIRADRNAESTGKSRSGGTCLYIKEVAILPSSRTQFSRFHSPVTHYYTLSCSPWSQTTCSPHSLFCPAVSSFIWFPFPHLSSLCLLSRVGTSHNISQ